MPDEVLTDCLKPGGLMKIGLYSDLTENILSKLEMNSKLGIEDNAAMKSFRNSIILSDKTHHKLIKTSGDFTA